MTVFVLIAILLTLATLAWLIVPLLRDRQESGGTTQAEASLAVLREQLAELERERAAGAIDAQAFDEAQRSLKRRILEDATPEVAATDRRHYGPAAALVVLLPLAAAGLYVWIGSPLLLLPQAAPTAAQAQHQAAELESVVAKLAERLRSNPDDAQGWVMLARSYRVLGRHEDAAGAFARAETAIGADAARLTEWAESLALASGGTLAGRPAELIARALALEPDNGHALALAGAAAFERRDWNAAIGHWERLLKQFPAGSEQAETVSRSLAAAREELARVGGAPPPALAATPKPGATSPPAAAAPKGLQDFRLAGQVSLAPQLASKATPEDTVFIFARPAKGSRRPLAVLRKQVKDLPFDFALDGSSAMMAETDLAALGDIVVGARVSRSGNVVPQKGDLEGMSRPVKIGASGIRVVIDAALP